MFYSVPKLSGMVSNNFWLVDLCRKTWSTSYSLVGNTYWGNGFQKSVPSVVSGADLHAFFSNLQNFQSKILKIRKFFEKVIFWKINFFHFSKLSFEKIFFENRVMKKMSQKVFGSNFSKNKYFYLNPKAYEQAWPWLSFPLLDIKNGPVREKLSRFFVRGGIN